MIGNNVEVIGSQLLLTANPLCDAWAEWRRNTLSQPRLLLDNLLGAVHSCLQRRLPTSILCCLLLSAASVPGKGGLDCSSPVPNLGLETELFAEGFIESGCARIYCNPESPEEGL